MVQLSHGQFAFSVRLEDVNAKTFQSMLDTFLILSRGEVRWRTEADVGQHFEALLSCPALGNVTFGITNSKPKSTSDLMKAVGRPRVYLQGATKPNDAVQKRILVALRICVKPREV